MFYIIQKPQIMINRKLYKTQKVYNIVSINDYLNNLGKLKLYTSIIFLFGFIIAIYMDINKCSHSYVIIIFYLIFNDRLNKMFKRRIKKYLVEKNTKTIDE